MNRDRSAPETSQAPRAAPHAWQADPDSLERDDTPWLEAIRRDIGRVPVVRLVITALLVLAALFLARFSWGVADRDGYSVFTPPVVVDAERALYDTRASFAQMDLLIFGRTLFSHAVEQDQRILMVVYTPETLEKTAKRSPVDRTILAQALTNIDALRPKAIGIDILIDQTQPEDPALLSAMRALKTPVWLAYGSNATNQEDVALWQQEFMDNWHRQLAGSNVRRTSIRVQADPDNVMRQWPPVVAGLPPFMPIAITGLDQFAGYQGSVLFRQPKNPEFGVFTSLPIDLFADPAMASAMADQVRGRYVLVGADIPDQDRFNTPPTRLSGESIAGLEVLAHETAQLLDGRMPGRVGGGMLWVLAFLVVTAGAFTAMLDVRPWVSIGIIIFQLAFFGATPFLFEAIGMDTYGLPAFGWLAGWLVAFVATGSADRAVGSDQKRYAQSALGKYLPKDIAAQILRDPKKLSLTGEKRAIYTLFTDIEGFTALSHVLPAERVANLLNAYLDGMSNIVLDHGGTIDKFVGDAVVAFWGAPIARPDDADRAIAAMIAMTRFTKNFSLKDSNDGAMMGRTRVGLHYGEAVVGNFGGEGRLTYTALGDAMNCAARLEGANKYLKTIGLASEDARSRSTSEDFRPMGRIAVSGRSTPLLVWEPVPDMDPHERMMMSQWWTRFDTGDHKALDELEQFSLTKNEDIALAALVQRLRSVGPGGFYELREK